MPERELLSVGLPLTTEQLCERSSKWLVTPEVFMRVTVAARSFAFQTGREVFIISGWRSKEEQARLGRQGRPTATEALSTHRSCLATGIDVDLGFLVPKILQVRWGAEAVFAGLRWGGGSRVDPETGIPSDWNHVDLGPRLAEPTGLPGPFPSA